MPKPIPVMTSLIKNSNPKLPNFLSKLQDFRIFNGCEQLSSSIDWRVMMAQVCAKNVSQEEFQGLSYVFRIVAQAMKTVQN